jgi:poly(3-hydroxybutyrate) depolymerase
MPALILHGSGDPLITYNCGTEARDFWVKHNGCSSTVDVKQVRGGKCEYHQGCPKGGQVIFCSFDGMGHGWAGHLGSYGGGTQYEDASALTWEFFKSL